jgi:hypothetical protein
MRGWLPWHGAEHCCTALCTPSNTAPAAAAAASLLRHRQPPAPAVLPLALAAAATAAAERCQLLTPAAAAHWHPVEPQGTAWPACSACSSLHAALLDAIAGNDLQMSLGGGACLCWCARVCSRLP